MFARKTTISDRRPPPPVTGAVGPIGACERCGLEVLPFDRLPGVAVRHFVCDPGMRDGVTRRIEAMRALHRAVLALQHLPDAKAQLERELARLPDVADVGEILDLLSRVRVSVECAPNVAIEQRRLALSYLDALTKKLAS